MHFVPASVCEVRWSKNIAVIYQPLQTVRVEFVQGGVGFRAEIRSHIPDAVDPNDRCLTDYVWIWGPVPRPSNQHPFGSRPTQRAISYAVTAQAESTLNLSRLSTDASQVR